jgi:beta-carotene 3-hydroxylase
VLTVAGIALVTLVAFEPSMALVHRFVFHGPLWCWHESHHAHPTARRIVRNDLLWLWPLAGAAALVAVGGPIAIGIGIGTVAYVGAYILAHDGIAHGRFPVPAFLKRMRTFRLLADMHHLHHRGGRRGGASPFAVYAAPLEQRWQMSEAFVPAPKPCPPARVRAARA